MSSTDDSEEVDLDLTELVTSEGPEQISSVNDTIIVNDSDDTDVDLDDDDDVSGESTSDDDDELDFEDGTLDSFDSQSFNDRDSDDDLDSLDNDDDEFEEDWSSDSSIPVSNHDDSSQSSDDSEEVNMNEQESDVAGQEPVQTNDINTHDEPQEEEVMICSTPPGRSGAEAMMNASQSSQSPSGDTCIICLEPWTNSSEHRLVSLNCGHLFGKSCIEKWIKSNGSKARCPQCNASVKLKEIRCLYAKSVRVKDTSEVEKTANELLKERELRKKVEFDLAVTNQKLAIALKESERLKHELMQKTLMMNKQLACNTERVITEHVKKAKLNHSKEPLQKIRDIEISASGGCKIVVFANFLNSLAVSQPSPNPLFKGYGVKKVSMHDLKSNEYIHIHSKVIKDMAVNRLDGSLLTCSFDKTIKLTSLISNSLVLSYETDIEPWSVSFSSNNNNEIFAGMRNGSIRLYDMRMTSSHVDTLVCTSHTPVVSLTHISGQRTSRALTGLLSAQLDLSHFHQRLTQNSSSSFSSKDFVSHALPFEGTFTSSHFEKESGHVLVSCRPSTKHVNFTHYVLNLSMNNRSGEGTSKLDSEIVGCFEGGNSQLQLTKSRLFSHPMKENTTLLCSGDESSNGALIWDINSGNMIQKLTTETPVFDMSLIRDVNTDSHYLAALTDSKLKVYKFIS